MNDSGRNAKDFVRRQVPMTGVTDIFVCPYVRVGWDAIAAM